MNNSQPTTPDPRLKTIRRAANIGLYGSLAVVILTVIFHFLPWHITYQSPQATRWMLIAGAALAALAVVMMLLIIRKNPPRIRQLDTLDEKMNAYREYIMDFYYSTLTIVVSECTLIVLMSDTSLLMVTLILVLLLFLVYPNMYKMKSDLGLLQEEFNMLFPEYAENPECPEYSDNPENPDSSEAPDAQ